jgi:hypothetical protein
MRLVTDPLSAPLDIELTEEEILADLLYPAPVSSDEDAAGPR